MNHNGDIGIAKELIDIAAESGADAVKFQTFVSEELILKAAPKADYHIETTGTDSELSWFDLLKSQELSLDDHITLKDHANKRNIEFASTPYDIPSVDLLESIDISFYKVASSDTNNFLLLENLAKKNKPIILSTAMSTIEEVSNSVNLIKQLGCNEIIVLQCTGNYPAPINEANLKAMQAISETCDVITGYSDHVIDSHIAIAAVALGARVYEKHFTLDKKMTGPDHRASIDPDELKSLITAIRDVELSMGDGVKRIMSSETDNREKLRKYLVASCNISKGEQYTRKNITAKRTGGLGFSSDAIYEIIGKVASRDFNKDEIIDSI